ncbi:Proteasome subunit alpha/beta [Carpediemonas membranifera]|uniref:Proteasome subunit beta n=1 Tax=Carpediemonas membranifera TaxID=201153 RepID=A0A8J6AQT3_9EUKA|nr:Proteasome subunit alpha/beta [Carpediemonas membranifera]|eukprot:KAG9389735.1 Proteasome subunit alpha/beta [Carpediemonas membranifera]
MGDISTYNGSAILAMTGKNCVAIISDKRFGVQYQTISMDFDKIYSVTPKLFYGLGGLVTDMQTFSSKLKFRTNLYEIKNGRTMEPAVLTKCISSMLYEKRFGPFFVQPVIAGLDKDNKPFIASMDSIGACTFPDDFVVGGTAEENLFGMSESLWRPDMEADDLKHVCTQCFLAGINRDALSGWGAVLYLITPDGVIREDIEGRMD